MKITNINRASQEEFGCGGKSRLLANQKTKKRKYQKIWKRKFDKI